MITLTNDFHGTIAKVKIEYFQPLSRYQEYRIRSKLCPTAGYHCDCQGNWPLGQSGANNPLVTFEGPLLHIVFLKGLPCSS